MPTTTNSALRYPASSAAPNIPQDIQNLASDVDTKMPRGEIGTPGTRTSTAGPVNSGAGWVTVSGLQTVVTLATARKLRLNFQAQATSNVSGTTVGTRILNQTTSSPLQAVTQYIATANNGEGLTIVSRTSLAAGTYTFVIQQAQFGGTGGAYLTADLAVIWAEDTGPG